MILRKCCVLKINSSPLNILSTITTTLSLIDLFRKLNDKTMRFQFINLNKIRTLTRIKVTTTKATIQYCIVWF